MGKGKNQNCLEKPLFMKVRIMKDILLATSPFCSNFQIHWRELLHTIVLYKFLEAKAFYIVMKCNIAVKQKDPRDTLPQVNS